MFTFIHLCVFLKSAHKQDKGLWALFPTPQCLWSALGRLLLCSSVSPLVPCGASLHALISDLDAVYMPEAVRQHTELSQCAACTFLGSRAMTKPGSSVNLQMEPLTTGQSAIWSSGLKTAALMACKVTVMHINWEWRLIESWRCTASLVSILALTASGWRHDFSLQQDLSVTIEMEDSKRIKAEKHWTDYRHGCWQVVTFCMHVRLCMGICVCVPDPPPPFILQMAQVMLAEFVHECVCVCVL